MQVRRGVAPIPRGDHDIAFNAFRPIGLRKWEFTGSDAVRPVSKQFERNLRIEPRDVARHEVHRTARLKAFRPGVGRILKLAEFFANGTHSGSSEGMA